MTDTPPALPTSPPTPWPEQLKSFIGDLARPFAIYAISVATSWSIIGGSTSDKVGAAGLILAALFGAKAYEVQQQAKAGASVEIAKANAGSSS